jgi:hypothetical protein
VSLIKSEQNFFTLGRAKTTRRGRPRVGSSLTFLTAQHRSGALPGRTYFPRNVCRREATMATSKVQLTLIVGPVRIPVIPKSA